MVYLGEKVDIGGLEGIIGGEGNRKEENAARIRRVTLFRMMNDTHEFRSEV